MPATKKPAHWTDIIPDLPIEPGVPVDWAVDPHPSDIVLGKKYYFGVNTPWGLADKHFWRIDLDDPAGMGYALRLLWQARRGQIKPSVTINSRHLLGETTDDDRFALAYALAKVMS